MYQAKITRWGRKEKSQTWAGKATAREGCDCFIEENQTFYLSKTEDNGNF